MATEVQPDELEKLSEGVVKMEKKIPVFTVLKNNSILKNIFLVDSPPSPSNSVGNNTELEEVLVIGRHPDCNITLEHPSISRFHLRIHSIPALQSLSVFDLSSVHGTWVSGMKVEPGVRVELHEGDKLQLGGSTRVYRLHWVPLSRAYDMKNPFVPPLDELEPVDERQGGTHTYMDDNDLHIQGNETETHGDCFEGSDLLSSDMNVNSPMRQLPPSAPLIPEDTKSTIYFEEDGENKISVKETRRLSETTEMPPVLKLNKEKSNLDWVPYDMKNSTVHAGDKPEPAHPILAETPDDCYNGLDLLFADMNMMSPKKQLTSSASLLPEDIQSPFSFDDAENKISFVDILQQIETAQMKPALQLDIVNSEPQVNVASADVQTFPQAEDAESPPVASDIRSGVSIWKRRGKSASVHVQTGRVRQNCTKAHTNLEMESESNKSIRSRSHLEGLFEGGDLVEVFFTPDKKKRAPDTLLLNMSSKQLSGKNMKHKLSENSLLSSTDEEGEDTFTPDKENMTPKTHLLWSTKKMEKLDEINHPKIHRSSPLKNASSNTWKKVCMPVPSENGKHSRKALHEKILDHSGSSSLAGSEVDVLKVREHRMPFQSLLMNSNKTTSEASDVEVTSRGCKSVGNIQIRESNHPSNTSSKGKSKTWTVVVDTACLLNKESRKALQLMQGLHGTSLIIPRIVIRELDCMNKHCFLFRRKAGVSSALQWIKDCMVNTKWWIHVQSSVEDAGPIAPTPRSWPLPQTSDEEKDKFSVGSVPFSPFGSFLDIVTPTTEDHILECALFFRKTLNKGQFVVLSDDVSLKIKAMAEGLLCETAKEFRESLVNPFSERFLWTDSSPRGPTWSCCDDVVLREKYYNVPSKKQLKVGEEAAKGLKLILLHNSNHKRISTVS